MGTTRIFDAPTVHARLARGAMLIALAAAAATSQAQVSLRTVVELAQSNSSSVKLAHADLLKAESALLESRDAFVPSLSFGSGLPAFPEVGFTGSLPTIWDANIQSMVFSLPQIRYIQAAKMGVKAAKLGLEDAKEQVALDASTAYIELDTINQELAAAHEQESDAGRMVEIEQQRVDGGVDPKSNLLQAQLSAAEVKLHRLHMETRAATLNKQLSTLTGLPVGTIIPTHDSIPEIPAVTADEPAKITLGIKSAEMVAESRERVQKGDLERTWLLPELGFGLQYNRNTTLLNDIESYFNPQKPFPPNNFSTGFSIRVPVFNFEARDKVKESAAEALRARLEAEQAQQQNDVQIAELSSSLRELDTLAEIARLKQQIAAEQLETVASQLELGNGSSGANAQPQLSPEAEQQARVDERQRFMEAMDAGFDLSKARLDLIRALGHMQDWLNELQVK
jgi:outer membrane protein TolC